MKFFNVDLHVSVIEDVAGELGELGHQVESHLMSGHHWALGKTPATRGTGDPEKGGRVGYGDLNLTTWESFLNDFPALERVAAWQEQHRAELEAFDGYIATYPPAFALLYERLARPTLAVLPIRYDLHFTQRPEAWKAFNERLARAQEAGRLVVVANSQYDAAYYAYFTGQPCRYISSTCRYIDRLSPKWSIAATIGMPFLAFGEHAGCRAAAEHVAGVAFVRDVFPQPYPHRVLASVAGVVWIPYNVSIMSFFEHYWLGVPLFVPTKRFLLELWKEGHALSQITWHSSATNGSNIAPAAREIPIFDSDGIRTDRRVSVEKVLDPHTAAGVVGWMDLYDFYNVEEFPHLVYFDSWHELERQLGTVDRLDISQKMLAHNAKRAAVNQRRWAAVSSLLAGAGQPAPEAA